MAISRVESLGNLKDDLYVRLLLWKSTKEWDELINIWNQTMFNKIDVEEIQSLCDKYARYVSKCKKKIPAQNEILIGLEKKVKEFSSTMPVVVALRNDKLKEHHLQQIKDIIGVNFDLENLILKDLIDMNVFEHQIQIIEISVQVTEEAKLEKKLDDIDAVWKELDIKTKQHKEEQARDPVYI